MELYHVRTGKRQLVVAPLRGRSKQVLNRRGWLSPGAATALEIAGGAEAARAKAALEERRYRDIGSRRRPDPARGGAGLDVYEGEPEVAPELIAMENVVLLPHLGSATTEARVAMGMTVLDNAEAFFAGQTPPNRVA
jgi:hypothetical protein